MDPKSLINGTYKVTRRLSSTKTCLLVSQAEKKGRSFLVLKPLPFQGPGPLRNALRPDILDLASLIHETFAPPTSFGTDQEDGRPFLLRPFIDGMEILEATPGMPPARLLPWLVGAAEALAILHRFEFIHGNMKPANLLVPRAALARTPRSPRVVLCDPSLRLEREGRWEEDGFQAPELDHGGPTFASDLYALGAIYYRLLTGRNPRAGKGGFPPPPREIQPHVPIDLDRLLMKLLAPDPDHRHPDARALVEDFRRITGTKRIFSAPPECFLGRRGEVNRVLDRIERRSVPAAIALCGEAGMGKSSFLRRIQLEAQVLGYETFFVCCYTERDIPSSPIRLILRDIIKNCPARKSLLSRSRKLLAELSAPEDAAARRSAFLRGVLDLLAQATANRHTLVLFDEVHLADTLTVELLAGLVRDIAGASVGGDGSGPPSLAVSFRNEAPFRAVLDPLLEALSSPGKGHGIIELGPLPEETVKKWLRLTLQGDPEEAKKTRLALRFQGSPYGIREILRRGMPSIGVESLSSLHLEYLASLDGGEQGVLEVLAVLGRPAPLELLEVVLQRPLGELRHAAENLIQQGILRSEGGLLSFRHGSFQGWLQESLSAPKKQAIHGKIAGFLSDRKGEPIGEVAYHWLHSKNPRRGFPVILEAARHMARIHEDRQSMDFYEAALGLVPPGSKARWREIADEVAEASSLAGQHRRAIEIIEQLLEERKPEEEGHLHGRLGVFLHRAGEIAGATVHLEKAALLLSENPAATTMEERILCESELAEIASFQGDYSKAEALASRALEKLGARKEAGAQPEILRLEMVLLETLAHLRLRRFRYGEARKLFERSLELSEGIGALRERALIFNNLGILYNQENRFRESIECYRRAEKIAIRLGEDSTLANIHSNLAILQAKLGKPEAASDALLRAAHHEARCDATRARFLRLHAAGLVDSYFGRYASAIESFKAAIALGEELKDLYVVVFDLAYLGECHLFRGEMKAARVAFDRALHLDPGVTGPLTEVVDSRRAILFALLGESAEATRCIDSLEKRSGEGLPYLHAWNQFLGGWALRLLGEKARAESHLKKARAAFTRWSVSAGRIQSELELAALEADGGNPERARKRIQTLRKSDTCGRGALSSPMLAARLLSYQARFMIEGKQPDYRQAASLLFEAESYLIGQRLPDIEELVRSLRRRLRVASLTKPGAELFPDPPRDLSHGIEIVDSFFGMARGFLERLEDDFGSSRTGSLRRQLRELEEYFHERRRALEGKRPAAYPPVRAGSILGSSVAIEKVRYLVRQIAPSGLPVLISGETGTGKELVARAIHGESRRGEGPFVTLNCAVIPGELLEAELFGYSRGAFTGAEKDSAGLLATAGGGTFFFDEIADLPLGLQGKILRLLDDRRLRPLGDSSEIEVDIRFLFSTNRNLQDLIEEGKFRSDLFFRLGAVEVIVPPLRERIEDLPELVEYFRTTTGGEGEVPRFSDEALRALAIHLWPGNIRELRAVVTRLLLTSRGTIQGEDVRALLDFEPAKGLFSPSMLRSWPLDRLQSQLEKEYFFQLFLDHAKDVKATAAAMGVSLQALYKRFKIHGIRPKDLK